MTGISAILPPQNCESQANRDLRGTAELSWLLPIFFAERRFATIKLFGSGGSVVNELSDPFSDAKRGVFSVGCDLTFSFPGANSLIEMIREQQ